MLQFPAGSILSKADHEFAIRSLVPQAPMPARFCQRLSEEVRDTIIINLTPDVIHSSVKILETAPVRTMDALHVACASAWAADLFVSADHRQLAAAKTVGLKTRHV